VEAASAAARIDMNTDAAPSTPSDALDELVDQPLNCGGVLSQLVGHMIKAEAARRADPGSVPIPEVAHGVIRDALGDLPDHHPDDDLETAARIVEEATNAICQNVFLLPTPEPKWTASVRRWPAGSSRHVRRWRRRGSGR
jgi:hypothetical protein